MKERKRKPKQLNRLIHFYEQCERLEELQDFDLSEIKEETLKTIFEGVEENIDSMKGRTDFD